MMNYTIDGTYIQSISMKVRRSTQYGHEKSNKTVEDGDGTVTERYSMAYKSFEILPNRDH